MTDACRALSCPVVSGNVSLYNETSQSRILPTPLVTAVGLVEGTPLRWGRWKSGDRLFLVGAIAASLAGSQYQLLRLGASRGRPLPPSFEAEETFISRARETARSSLARSGRAIAGGGLALALVREAAASGEGAVVSLSVPARPDVLLYGEGGPRALYSVTTDKVEAFLDVWRGFPLLEIGLVGGDALHVRGLFSLSSAEIGRREDR